MQTKLQKAFTKAFKKAVTRELIACRNTDVPQTIARDRSFNAGCAAGINAIATINPNIARQCRETHAALPADLLDLAYCCFRTATRHTKTRHTRGGQLRGPWS